MPATRFVVWKRNNKMGFEDIPEDREESYLRECEVALL